MQLGSLVFEELSVRHRSKQKCTFSIVMVQPCISHMLIFAASVSSKLPSCVWNLYTLRVARNYGHKQLARQRTRVSVILEVHCQRTL